MNEEYVGICFLVVQTVCEEPETTSYKQSRKVKGMNKRGGYTMAFNTSAFDNMDRIIANTLSEINNSMLKS